MRPKTFQLANGRIVQNTLTASEQASALAAYYHAPMAPVPGRVLQGLNQGPIDASKMMPFTDINRLFDPGYLPDENSYGVFNDGSCYAASLIDMPGVTGEMLDCGLPGIRSRPSATRSGFPVRISVSVPMTLIGLQTPLCPIRIVIKR